MVTINVNINHHIRFKICCIKNLDEAKLAIQAGASAVGLVSEMPSGPGVIEEEMIAAIARQIPPGVESFLLTSKQTAGEIITQHKKCRTTSIQICDDIPDHDYQKLRDSLPGIKLIQVIHVSGEESIEKSKLVEEFVNAILLDSGNQKKEVKELGGTGRTHNWEISKKIVEEVGIPVFLAGGLNQQNVGEAIRVVKPFGVDICSGVRTNGSLDEVKLQSFVKEINNYNFRVQL